MVTEPTAFSGPTGATWLASISHALDALGPEGRGRPEAGRKVTVTQEEGCVQRSLRFQRARGAVSRLHRLVK